VKKRPYGQPKALREVLGGVLRGLRGAAGGEAGKVRDLWPEVVGAPTAAKTRVASLEDGTLTVEVASSALKHHLSTFLSGEILEALGRKLPALRIRAIRYKVGQIRETG
jgi:hypothetical protein